MKAGLYKANTTELVYSWEELLQKKVFDAYRGWLNLGSGAIALDLECDLYFPDELVSINLPNRSQPENIFSKLNKIVFPANLAFLKCPDNSFLHQIPHLEVAEGCERFYSQNNCIIRSEDKTIVVGCINSKLSADMDVQRIGNHAFENCNFTEIDLPQTLQVVGEYAFYGNLMSQVVLPDTVEVVYEHAFGRCKNLQKFVFGKNASRLSEGIFDETPLAELVFADAENWERRCSAHSYSYGFEYSQSSGHGEYGGSWHTTRSCMEKLDLSDPKANAALFTDGKWLQKDDITSWEGFRKREK